MHFQLVALLATAALCQVFDDFDEFDRHTVIITESDTVITTQLITPTFFTTIPYSTTTIPTATPTPTPSPCDQLLRECVCPAGYRCQFDKPPGRGVCPNVICVPECVKCEDRVPQCKCRDDQLCVLNKGSCFQCSFASCLDVPSRCVECPTCPPKCSCDKPSGCVYHPQTCDQCAHYTCGVEDDEACPDVGDACDPPCGDDQVCSVRRGKVTGCMTRVCLPKDCDGQSAPLLTDPCATCTDNEECLYVDGSRKCVPKHVEPCIKCPRIDGSIQCGEHEHLIIEPNTCQQCGVAVCKADRCINCFAPPIPKTCQPDEDLVLFPPSCYSCGKYECVKRDHGDDLICKDCDGLCVVKDIVDGLPVLGCEDRCVRCPEKINCNAVKCPEGYECTMTPRSCRQCPRAVCTKKHPKDCPRASCLGILCRLGTKCVYTEGDEHTCPKAECIPEDDCIICPQVIPQCNCADPDDCFLVKQSCLACAHYKCIKSAVCPIHSLCERGSCTGTFRCFDIPGEKLSCPALECQADQCSECPELLPKCNCARNEACTVTVGDCYTCAKAECTVDPNCIECPDGPIKCECGEHEEAVFNPGNCKTCPFCTCRPKPCINCPLRDVQAEDCAQCKDDEVCKVTPRDCYRCERGDCVSKCVTCDPRDAQCNCKSKEECVVLPGNCETCPRAVCKPKCKPLACLCKDDETVEISTDAYGCPSCKCIPLACPAPLTLFPVRVGNKLKHTCVTPGGIRKCPSTTPQCHCKEPADCIYEGRTFASCAEYKCRNKCIDCPHQAPQCPCADPNQCILQPRDCDHCARYFCKEECVACPDTPVCPCKDPNDCILRPRTCLFCPHYECLPPSKQSRVTA